MQTEIALSTTEAEYIALSQAMREVLPIIWHASPYYVLATQRRSPPRVRGSGRTNVLALRVGIFQYNNVLVPTVRRVARMRRHLTSIHITYRYRELYDAYRKSAEG